jgi:Rrf2 family protein
MRPNRSLPSVLPQRRAVLPPAFGKASLRLDMIAQKTRYALRSLLFLAEEQGAGPTQLSRIAETQRVPPKYLELIMLDLKKAGLVKSARGPKGGYKLARTPEEISFGEIVRTMEGPIALVSCASVNFYAPCGDCHDEATCAIRRAFTILRDQSTAVLDSISLAEAAQWEERLPAANGSPAATS